VTQQLPGCRQCPRSRPRRSPGCLRGCTLLCCVHSSSARHRAAGNLRRGRSSFFSTRKSTKVSARCSTICTIILSKKTRKKPNARPPTWRAKCRRGNSPAGWRNATALNPKMRRVLSVLLVSWKMGRTQEHTRI
jgi:hypothetical protein